MKKLEQNMFLYILVNWLIYTIIALLIWPLLDFLWCKFLTHSEFIYSVVRHILEPIVFGIIMAVLSWFTRNKKNTKNY